MIAFGWILVGANIAVSILSGVRKEYAWMVTNGFIGVWLASVLM